MVLADRAPVKRPYRTWDDGDKAKVVAEARRIKADDPTIGDLVLIKKAQRVLDADKQRKINCVTTDSYTKWFQPGIKGAGPTQAPSEPKAPPKPQPRPVPIEPPPSPPKPCKCRPESATVPVTYAPIGDRPVADEMTEITTIEVLNTVIAALQESTAAVAGLGRSLTIGIDELRDDLKKQHDWLDKLYKVTQTGGVAPSASDHSDLRRELREHGKLLDRTLTLVANTAQSVSVLERKGSLPAERFIQPPTPIPNKNDTKPKIIVIGFDTGHWKNHIQGAVSSRCQILKFELARGEPKPYSEYDKVIVTKKVPDLWLRQARRFLDGDTRWIKVTGACHEITQAIRKILDEWS